MDTGAACRTYNVLAGEGRRVAAVLVGLQAFMRDKVPRNESSVS